MTDVMPGAPRALTVTMVTATSITITWTQSSDIKSQGVQLVQDKA